MTLESLCFDWVDLLVVVVTVVMVMVLLVVVVVLLSSSGRAGESELNKIIQNKILGLVNEVFCMQCKSTTVGI